jgi:hypothetical protein
MWPTSVIFSHLVILPNTVYNTSSKYLLSLRKDQKFKSITDFRKIYEN